MYKCIKIKVSINNEYLELKTEMPLVIHWDNPSEKSKTQKTSKHKRLSLLQIRAH